MNFSALSIKNPVPAIMLFILLSLAGLLAFKANKVQDFPDIELPIVTVSAVLDGAAPAQLETEVARKIEDSVASLQGVKNIYTKVLDGVATVTVEFVLEKDIAEGFNDVRDAVARIKADLPAEMRDPTVTKASTAGRVVLTFIATAAQSGGAPLDDQEVSWFVDNTVAKRLLSVPGVGAVKRVGGVVREIRVELDDARMAALKVAAVDVSRQLRSVQREAPGGRGDVSGAEQSVRTIGTVKTAAELAALDIPLADGRRVRLDQIARVLDTVAEPRSVAELDGKKVVGFEVFRTKGASEIDVARGARGHRRAAERARQHRAQGNHRQRLPGRRELFRLDGAALRGRAAGGAGGVVVLARLARHAGGGGGAAAVGDPRFSRPVPVRLHAQHRHLAVAGAGGGRAGRRRHRRD